jgi:hypothetical protein
MSSIERQILLTVAYSQQFSFPLTIREVWWRLLAPTDSFLQVTPQAFASSLFSLMLSKKLHLSQQYLYLSKQENSVSSRLNRLQTSQKKRLELQPLLAICRWIPWVCGVAITGSLAMNNADERADADVMIITENNRLWLVRPLLVLFSFLYGKRRSWNKKEENCWCLNLWLERRSLSVPFAQRSVYTAHEVIQADWQFSKGGVVREFQLANRWIRNYFYHTSRSNVGESAGLVSAGIFSQLLDLTNYLAFVLQKWYMKSHMTQERVQLSSAFFHPRDTRSLIVNNWKKVVRAL